MKGQFKYMEKRLNDLKLAMKKIKDIEMSFKNEQDQKIHLPLWCKEEHQKKRFRN
jgi:hypothetical protein